MRSVHVSLRYPPASGGVESYARELVERTRNTGQDRDVRVLTTKMRTHGPISELDPALLQDDPPYVQRLHHAKLPLISYPILQALQYYIGHHKPDIIHGYSFWYQSGDGAARYARKQRIPFIFHPMYYENDVRKKPIWQAYKRTVGMKTFAAADVVCVISPYEQSLITEAGFPVKRFELLPPGIDTKEFTDKKQNIFAEKSIKGPVLLAVNRLAPDKGLPELLAMMPAIIKEFPTVSLVLVGEDFGMLSSLKEQAKTLGVAQHVFFLGKVSREHLISAYQHATVFVHPSFYEAFGIVVAEAQAAGLPVVARDIAAIPYVASQDYGASLFQDDQIATSHILRLLGDEVVRQKNGEAGRKYVEKTFAWDTVIEKLLSLYSELLP